MAKSSRCSSSQGTVTALPAFRSAIRRATSASQASWRETDSFELSSVSRRVLASAARSSTGSASARLRRSEVSGLIVLFYSTGKRPAVPGFSVKNYYSVGVAAGHFSKSARSGAPPVIWVERKTQVFPLKWPTRQGRSRAPPGASMAKGGTRPVSTSEIASPTRWPSSQGRNSWLRERIFGLRTWN